MADLTNRERMDAAAATTRPMQTVVDALRRAGHTVVEPCHSCPVGFAANVDGIDVLHTGLSKEHDGADEVNAVRRAEPVGTAYIERTGRIWLIADGPTTGTHAHVYVGAYRDGDANARQTDALDALLAALDEFYGIDTGGSDVASDDDA